MQFETQRLTIRAIETADFNSLSTYRSDAAVARFMDFEVESPESTRNWIEQCIAYNNETPRFSHHSVIVIKSAEKVAGWISMGFPENTENAIADRAFGYALGPPYWGNGYMPEAVRGLLQYCFSILKVQSVSAQCSKENNASARVLQKAGMEFVRDFLSPRPKDGPSILYVARAVSWLSKHQDQDWRCTEGEPTKAT